VAFARALGTIDVFAALLVLAVVAGDRVYGSQVGWKNFPGFLGWVLITGREALSGPGARMTSFGISADAARMFVALLDLVLVNLAAVLAMLGYGLRTLRPWARAGQWALIATASALTAGHGMLIAWRDAYLWDFGRVVAGVAILVGLPTTLALGSRTVGEAFASGSPAPVVRAPGWKGRLRRTVLAVLVVLIQGALALLLLAMITAGPLLLVAGQLWEKAVELMFTQ
jgi:hypothetical protein